MAASRSLIEELARRLRERHETVAFAESCTGGLLSSMLTELPGVSDVYVGSIVAYSYPVKESALGVPLNVLNSLGAVSTPVAKLMASGVRTRLGSSWSASITGIAGPGGGTDQKPVGTVCFGIAGPGVERVDQQIFAGDRREVQRASAEHALRLLLIELGPGEGGDVASGGDAGGA